MSLSEEKQERLGAEDEATLKARKKTEEKVQRLKEAKNIADEAMWRTRTVADD